MTVERWKRRSLLALTFIAKSTSKKLLKRERWRETRDHMVFLPFAFAINVIFNLSNVV